MYGFLVILHVIVSILLVIVILMQASKGGGLAGTFGGSSTAIFGGRGAGSFLSKVTVGLAATFMMLAILISLVNVPTDSGDSIVRKMAGEEVVSPAADLPVPLSLPQEDAKEQ